jgi:hypothetical protein
MQLRHGVGEFFLVGPPTEELLQRPVLIAGIGVAIAAEKPDCPALDILPVYLVPAGAASSPRRCAAANHWTASVYMRTVLGDLPSAARLSRNEPIAPSNTPAARGFSGRERDAQTFIVYLPSCGDLGYR